jgi:hypothetical protein
VALGAPNTNSGLHHQTVQRRVERAVAEGPMAALDDRPRPSKEPTITLEAKAWLVSLACRKDKDLGYPHELRTTRLLASHARSPPVDTIATMMAMRTARPMANLMASCLDW